MKRRTVILLVVLGVVAAACGDNRNAGPSGVTRIPPTSTSLAPANGAGNPNLPERELVEPCEPPEELAAYCQPFTYDQGSLRIVWDRWYWGQGMFSRGIVEVYEGSDLIRSGPFADTSVMRQEPNGDLTFLDESGELITVVTQRELQPVIEAALQAAGIGNEPS